MPDRLLTTGEALVAALVTLLAMLIVAAYLWARVAPLSPFALLGFAVAAGIAVAVSLLRRARHDTAVLVASAGVAIVAGAWALSFAYPSFLPPGAGDLTHHLQLVDYIERHWRLPDARVEAVMGEMAHYTPGLHLLAALAGAWSRTDGLHAIYPIVAVAVALKCTLIFLIALRLMPSARDWMPGRLPLALIAVLLATAPQAYFLDSFLRDSFLAQVAAELFAVAMWWAIVVWDQSPARLPLLLFAAAGVGAFLTWPIWIGAPIVTLIAVALTHGDRRIHQGAGDLALALTPLALVALVHSAGRVGWLTIASTSGAVVRPAGSVFGWGYLALAAAGLVVAPFQKTARTTALIAMSIAVQAVTLYALAHASGASTPYMALKMFYLLIYPLAVLGALAIATVFHRGPDHLRHGFGGREGPRYVHQVGAWALLVVMAVAYWKPLTTVKAPTPAVSEDLYLAGRWARAHVEAACVDYLVPSVDTAYWLHLAVLGNPRLSARTADPATYDPDINVARWIEPGGLPYAIAYLPALPREVLSDVDVIEQVRTAAVLKRRGPSFCTDAQRLARVTP
jgi:hypothetical protein